MKNKIVFEDVWFRYEGSLDYALKGINLEIKKGEFFAIVGPTGAGKTSLVNLIPRFYDPQKGRISFDGLDIKKCSLKSLRSLIGIVTQEMVLFNDSVKANIAYGSLKVSEDKIKEAAKKAHAFDFIDRLSAKFDTVIGDRGFRLSGGEKQRIAIARAILKDAPILILDEATSQLDSASEQLIKEALRNLIKGKTVFVIAHRLSTVQEAGRIIVIDKGRIVEEGTHSSLLSKDTLYKKLYHSQFNP